MCSAYNARMTSPQAANPHPYEALTPDTILTALEQVGLWPSGSLLALNSYENRVYQVGMDEGPPLVAKFYRPERWSDAQILEEHAFALELAAAEIPVVAPMVIEGASLFTHGSFRFAVFPRRGGRPPELDQPGTLTWLGRFLGRIHAAGATQAYAMRPAVDIEQLGRRPVDWLLASGALPLTVRAAYMDVVEAALAAVQSAFERCGGLVLRRLHGDCHVGNVLWTDNGPHFVDFDDSRMGPAIQDLWMLLSGDRRERVCQMGDILAGYEDFCEFNERELHLIEALRTLRLIHYSAWLAQRWEDPAFPPAFPWFGSEAYWTERVGELRDQIALMLEPPLWPV